LSLAIILLVTESSNAQRFRRGRRVTYTTNRYERIVPVETYTTPAPTNPAFTIRVLLPTAEAELWVDGARKASAGTVRTVEFTPKNAGGRSQYVIEALWPQDGQVIKDTRVVDGHPGDRITVDFTRPDPKTNAEIVPKEVPGPK